MKYECDTCGVVESLGRDERGKSIFKHNTPVCFGEVAMLIESDLLTSMINDE